MSLLIETESAAPHVVELVEWLKGFRHTKGLRDIVARYKFTPEQAREFLERHGKWLTPKKDMEAKNVQKLG